MLTSIEKIRSYEILVFSKGMRTNVWVWWSLYAWERSNALGILAHQL